jgi:Ca2+-binding EF-hand superfamily protein
VDLGRAECNLTEGLPHALFDVPDVDEDNTLNKDEFVRYAKTMGAPEQVCLDTFTRTDIDGDEEISRQGFIRAAREFNSSAGTESPGAAIFGAL